ncbi:MAG: phage holin family protein [Elusimicrobia bacterium]|nr:phage holin family protein [Elusimicrobiota bacterium]
MKVIFLKWVVNIIALALVVYFLPGISIDTLSTTIIASVILTLLNTFLKPILVFLTLPLSIISLGFFTLIINGFIFYTVSRIVSGFKIDNFWSAFWGAIIFSVVSFLLNLSVNRQDSINFKFSNHNSNRNKYRNIIDVEAKEEKIP